MAPHLGDQGLHLFGGATWEPLGCAELRQAPVGGGSVDQREQGGCALGGRGGAVREGSLEAVRPKPSLELDGESGSTMQSGLGNPPLPISPHPTPRSCLFQPQHPSSAPMSCPGPAPTPSPCLILPMPVRPRIHPSEATSSEVSHRSGWAAP